MDNPEKANGPRVVQSLSVSLTSLMNHLSEGFALHEIVCDDQNRPFDYRFLAVNDAFEKLTGLQRENIIGKTVREVIPNVEPIWIEEYGKVALEGKTVRMTQYAEALGRHFEVTAYQESPGQFVTLFVDASDRFKLEGMIEQQKGRLQKADIDLKLLREQLMYALESADMGAWTVDLPSYSAWRSPEYFRIFGYEGPQDAFNVDRFFSYVISDEREELRTRFEKFLQSGSIWEIETRIRRDDGSIRWIWSKGRKEYDKNGKPVRVSGLIQDITERKTIEEKLREHAAQLAESENLFRTMGDAIDFGYWQTDVHGMCLFVSQSFLDLVGRTLEEVQNYGWLDVRVPDDNEEMLARWEHCVRTGENFEWEHRFIGKDGCLVTVLALGRPVYDENGEIKYWAGINLDITDRKAMERELEEKNQYLEGLFEHSPVGLAMFDAKPPYRVMTHNKIYQRYWPDPHATEGMVGLTVPEYMPDAEEAGVLEVFRDVSRSKEGRTLIEFPYDGMPRGRTWWNWHLSPILHNGEVVAFAHLLLEVTDSIKAQWDLKDLVQARTEALTQTVQRLEHEMQIRKRAEQELKQHAEVLRALIDNIPVMIVFYDPDGNFLLWNKEIEKVLGWTFEDIRKIDLMAEVYPDPTLRQEAWNHMMEAKREWKDIMVRTKSGRYLNTRWANVRLSDGSLIGIGLDITEIKHYEAELALKRRTAEKRAIQLQALTLSLSEAEHRERRRISEILHDHLQQILVAAKFHTGILRNRKHDPEGVDRLAKELIALLDQAIAGSRTLSHEISPPTLHHAGLFAGLKWLARRKLEKHGLKVTLQLNGDCEIKTEAMRDFLYRSVQELLLNVVKHSGVQEATVRVEGLEDRIRIVVEDHGAGFFPETIDIDEAQMAGFGLFSIRERMNYLGGALHIESAPGKGARFTIDLPISPEIQSHPKPEEPAEAEDTPASPSGSSLLRVLLVDDHKLMREGLANLLEEENDIEVVGQASNGLQGIEKARELSPDIIIMDITMPEMDGITATRQIKQEYPDIRIIGLSMHEDSEVSNQLLEAGAETFLNKAGPVENLLDVMRKIGATRREN